jgi:hypothetical protein
MLTFVDSSLSARILSFYGDSPRCAALQSADNLVWWC